MVDDRNGEDGSGRGGGERRKGEGGSTVESGGGTPACACGGGGRICGCKKEPSNISARDDRATERPLEISCRRAKTFGHRQPLKHADANVYIYIYI